MTWVSITRLLCGCELELLQTFVQVYYTIGLFFICYVNFLSGLSLHKEMLSKKPIFDERYGFLCRKTHNLFVPEFEIHKHSTLFMWYNAVIFFTLFSCFGPPYLHNSDNTPDADVIYSFQEPIKEKILVHNCSNVTREFQ